MKRCSIITWQMNARYYDLEWFRYNKVKRLYPKWFASETLTAGAILCQEEAGPGPGAEKDEGFLPGGSGERGELCKGVT